MEVVLVKATGPDPKLVKSATSPNSSAADGQTTLACSGLLFDDLPGLVITCLSPLLPFLQSDLRSRPSAAAGPSALLPGARLVFAGPGCPDGVEASIERIVEVPGAAAALRALLTAPSSTPWGVGWGSAARGASLGAQIALGSHIVVLKLKSGLVRRNESERIRETVKVAPLMSLASGAAVAGLGCPFGALVSLKFHAFMVNGIISTIAPSKDPKLSPVIALADLRCLPGMEGGAVVAMSPKPAASTHSDGSRESISSPLTLIGLLTPPLRAPEAHAETAVVLSATAVLGAVRAALGLPSALLSTIDHLLDAQLPADSNQGENLSSIEAPLDAVVAVDVGNGWASGVLVSTSGHVLTASHVLPPSLQPSKLQVMAGGQWRPASVVHVFSQPLDLAVLRIQGNYASNPPPSVRLCSKIDSLRQGERVFVAGFPLWRPQGAGPIVTAGTAALVTPAAVVTTAAVHAGASGGPVLDSRGALVGLVTSNTRLVLNSSQRAFLPNQDEYEYFPGSKGSTKGPAMLFPHLNYVLGPAALAPAVRACLEGREPNWAAVEAEMKVSGVMDTWRSMRSMEGPQKERGRRGPAPPALADMLRRLEGPQSSKL